MPQISGPNLQENHIIETCKEERKAVSTQENAARREGQDEPVDGPIAVLIRKSSTDSRKAFIITLKL
jgi:hypothetical protein